MHLFKGVHVQSASGQKPFSWGRGHVHPSCRLCTVKRNKKHTLSVSKVTKIHNSAKVHHRHLHSCPMFTGSSKLITASAPSLPSRTVKERGERNRSTLRDVPGEITTNHTSLEQLDGVALHAVTQPVDWWDKKKRRQHHDERRSPLQTANDLKPELGCWCTSLLPILTKTVSSDVS